MTPSYIPKRESANLQTTDFQTFQKIDWDENLKPFLPSMQARYDSHMGKKKHH